MNDNTSYASCAFDNLWSNLQDPKAALLPFESILLCQYEHYDSEAIKALWAKGQELEERIEAEHLEVPKEIATFVELLACLSLYQNGSSYSTSVVDLLQHVRQVLAHE